MHTHDAKQMAHGVPRAVAVEGRAADVGISTTGVAGPDSPDGQPVGTVHVGVVTPSARTSFSFVFDGDRAGIRRQSVEAALLATFGLVAE